MKSSKDDNTRRIIRKIPFDGTGGFLIDFICIIGFEENYIEEEIIMKYPKVMYYKPTVVNSIISENTDRVFDENKLIKIIYPRAPRVTDNSIVKDYVSNVVFSFPLASSCDGNDNMKENSQCAFSRLFYESYVPLNKKNNYKQLFIPKAISIVSRFPYFTTFSIICQRIISYWQNSCMNINSIPLEVILHSIVNYIPSPLNSELYLNVFPITKKTVSNDDDSMKMYLSQLTGYPLINFNLGKVLSLFSLSFIIEVFIFSIIEVDMFFFSKNLEILNIMMYTFYLFNYPLNDSMNFWHIFSLSREDLINDTKPPFIKNILSKCILFLGVNCQYDDNITFPSHIKSYTIIDLDNKRLIHKGNDIDTVNQRESVSKYIQRCIKIKETKSHFLGNLIQKLIESLGLINMTDKKEEIRRTVTVNSNVLKLVNLFEYNKTIGDTNKRIQEAFYTFLIHFLKTFYTAYSVSFDHTTSSILKDNNSLYTLNYNEHIVINYELEERIIVKIFTESTKYDNFFNNYLYDFVSLSNYKNPLLFSEEYLNIDLSQIQLKNDYDSSTISFYFDPIDSLYQNDSHKAHNTTISFDSFYHHYENDSITHYKKPTNQLLQLDKKRLIKAIHFCTNFPLNLKAELFPYNDQQSVIKKIDSSQVTIAVEQGMISANIVEPEAIILTVFYTLFSFTNFNVPFDIALITFNQLTAKLIFRHFFKRKYLLKILMVFECVINSNINKGDGDYNRKMFYIHNFYHVLINLIKSTNVFPNEEMKEVMQRLKTNTTINNVPVYDSTNDLMKRDDHIEYSIQLVNKNNKKINEDKVIHIIRESISSYTIHIDDDKVSSKIGLIIYDTKEKSNDNKDDIHYDKLYDLYSPVKTKEISEKLCNQYIHNDGNINILTKEHNKDFIDIIINAIYYSTLYHEYKMFTQYFLTILKSLNTMNP